VREVVWGFIGVEIVHVAVGEVVLKRGGWRLEFQWSYLVRVLLSG
jgi:hypothetical protein